MCLGMEECQLNATCLFSYGTNDPRGFGSGSNILDHDHRLSLRRQPGQKGRGLNTTPKQNQKAKPPPTARSNLSAKNPPAPDMFSANSLSADEDDSYNDERQRMDLSRRQNLQEER